MIVYNFVSEKNALSNLNNKRIKVSQIDDLNDPFELLAMNLSDKVFRKAILETRREINDKYGIICFSLNWKSPLLWGHYADKHRGICLGFDVPEEHLQKIDYVDARELTTFNLIEDDSSDFNKMDKLLRRKFVDWEYEEEYRAWVNLEEKDKETGLFFTDFTESLILKEIIIGPRNKLSPTSLFKLIKPNFSGIKIIKSRIAFQTYTVVHDKKYQILYR